MSTAAIRARNAGPIAHVDLERDVVERVAEAIRRGRALEGEGVAWLEEPIRHDDYAGNATVARALAVPVQIGENFNGPKAMIEALAARACDYVMPDAARIGGVSGWIQAPASLQRTASRCRRICCQRSARTFSPRARPATTWSMSTGPTVDPRGAAADPGWPRTRSGPSGHRTHVEIGSREGTVAGPLISHHQQ